ncbi:MAG: hypothetical protein QG675_551 [Patescibacteria group bacterium]|jgi:hypothetical protein|nr:hypothetical protein [Patescibacteria group bacterium]
MSESERFDERDIEMTLPDGEDPIVTRTGEDGGVKRLSTVEQNAEIILALTERARKMLVTIYSKRALSEALDPDEQALYDILNRIDRN